MGIRANGFDREIDRFTKEAEDEIRAPIVALDQAIVSRNPVDTGLSRANWFMDFGTVRARTTQSIALPSITRGNAWKFGAGDVFFHNSVDYIVYLDDGSSAQAPQGIVDPAIADVRGRFG